MPSVAKRILSKLVDRLKAIDGTGEFNFNLKNNVLIRRPSYDRDDCLPAIFIYRRNPDSREHNPELGFPVHTVIYDVVGLVQRTDTAGEALEDLLADIERALEIPSDLCLRDGKNLLGTPLRLVTGETELAPDGSRVEAVSVGVQCTFPHKYGDPNYVF